MFPISPSPFPSQHPLFPLFPPKINERVMFDKETTLRQICNRNDCASLSSSSSSSWFSLSVRLVFFDFQPSRVSPTGRRRRRRRRRESSRSVNPIRFIPVQEEEPSLDSHFSSSAAGGLFFISEPKDSASSLSFSNIIFCSPGIRVTHSCIRFIRSTSRCASRWYIRALHGRAFVCERRLRIRRVKAA